jgi:hypothetical protein
VEAQDQPAAAAADLYSPDVRREYELLRSLVGPDHSFAIAEYEDWREDCLLAEDGTFHVDSRQFRHGLCRFLGFRDRDVHGGPLDAIFGNQDGHLNGHDTLTEEQFGARLETARSFFAAQRRSGGGSFEAFLARQRIYFLSAPASVGQSGSEDFDRLLRYLISESVDQSVRDDFRSALESAGQAWVELARSDGNEIEAQQREVYLRAMTGERADLRWLFEDETEGESEVGEGETPRRPRMEVLRELIMFTYLGRFDADRLRQEVRVSRRIDWEDDAVAGNFIRGYFADFVLADDSLRRGQGISTGRIAERADDNRELWVNIEAEAVRAEAEQAEHPPVLDRGLMALPVAEAPAGAPEAAGAGGE